MPLDIVVTVSRGRHNLPQHLGRKIAHDLPEILPLTTASACHRASSHPRPNAAPTPTPLEELGHYGQDHTYTCQAM
jgi:hypothetical protein